MKQLSTAFSLIELMVVVAIIGILATAAIPAYHDYLVKSKVAAARHTIDAMQDQLMEAYNKDGVFPALNYPAGTGNSFAFPPYVQSYSSSGIASGASCKGASVTAYISNIDGGPVWPDPDSVVVTYEVTLYNLNGVVQSTCGYEYRDNTGNMSSVDLLPGCFNLTTQAADYSAAQDALAAQCS